MILRADKPPAESQEREIMGASTFWLAAIALIILFGIAGMVLICFPTKPRTGYFTDDEPKR